MTTDNKTLADVQPGGMVRLGDQALRVFSAGRWTYDGTGQSFSHEEMDAAAFVVYRDAALSAQPSPGGQITLETARELLAAEFDKNEVTAAAARRLRNHNETAVEAAALRVIAARQPSKQPDSVALGEATEFCSEKGDRQPVGEPVAVVGPDFQLFWFGSGPISPLVERNGLRPGSKLYASPAQAVDLGGIPEGWRLSKKATCYQLSHGDHIIGNLVGPDAEENAAIIARVLDSHSAGGKP